MVYKPQNDTAENYTSEDIGNIANVYDNAKVTTDFALLPST